MASEIERYKQALKTIAEKADCWADTDRDQWVFDEILDLAKLSLNPEWGAKKSKRHRKPHASEVIITGS